MESKLLTSSALHCNRLLALPRSRGTYVAENKLLTRDRFFTRLLATGDARTVCMTVDVAIT
jgi:hypothetical protein